MEETERENIVSDTHLALKAGICLYSGFLCLVVRVMGPLGTPGEGWRGNEHILFPNTICYLAG